jgi:hypothetical protein
MIILRRHREARDAVAIQGHASGACCAALDRHASLAMTARGDKTHRTP